MVRVLCIGDSHIPNRAKNLSKEISEYIVDFTAKEGLFDFTLFTGDLINCPQLLEFLNLNTKKDLLVVLGNMDYHYGNQESPIYQDLDVYFEDNDKITIGLTHGAQIRPRGDYNQLENLAIQKDCNILISGHTHKEEIKLTNKRILLINPGSVTGAWSFVTSGIPSFIVLDIIKDEKTIVVHLIQLNKKTKIVTEFQSYFTFNKNKILKIKY